MGLYVKKFAFLNPSYKKSVLWHSFFLEKGIYWVDLTFLLNFFAAQKIRNAIVPGISVSVFCLLPKIRNVLLVTGSL